MFERAPGFAPPLARTDFPLLFQPYALREIGLRNRLVFQPHFTALATRTGMLSDDLIAYHEARARGGVGLIILESQAVHPSGKMSRRFIDAWNPVVVPLYRRLTDRVHAYGTRVFGQLTHAGHTSLEQPPPLLWAPTQMPEPSSHFTTKAMDEDDIKTVIHGFATSARNAQDGGFDGIEIKIAHDGLLRSFASPFFNRRTDRYGGSFENRIRLSVEVLTAIKQAVGDKYPLGVRICLHEFTPFGYDLEYGLRLAEALESSGLVDYFNSDAGSFSSYWMEIPPASVAAGTFRKLHQELKRSSRLPVVAFGRISPPSLAEEILAAGEADLIGMARQLITDPETPNKLREGRPDRVRLCIACNDACIYQVGQEKAIRCVHNPAAGRERTVSEQNLPRADRQRRVVVVGGGPVGLKVAETAARRGHDVILFEREAELGGQIRLAARQSEHALIGEVTRYLQSAIRELGVAVRSGEPADVARLAALSPDIVVLATGSEPNLPAHRESTTSRELGRQVPTALPGLDLPFVVSADQVLSFPDAPCGRVLVIDLNGHWEAAGTAEYLADHGCQVEIAAPGPLIASDLEGGTRTLFYRRAAIKGIRMRPGTLVRAIEPGRVLVAASFSTQADGRWGQYMLLPGDETWLEGYDFIVPVLGRCSRDDLWYQCRNEIALAGCRLERVGDCVAPRLLQDNIAEAFHLGTQL